MLTNVLKSLWTTILNCPSRTECEAKYKWLISVQSRLGLLKMFKLSLSHSRRVSWKASGAFSKSNPLNPLHCESPLRLWPWMNVFWPLWFPSPFLHFAHFHMLSGPLNLTQHRMLKPCCVQLSRGCRQQHCRTEHPLAQIKVKDTERRRVDHKNKHRGLTLTSAAWTMFPREERCRLLPRLKLLSSDVWSQMSLLCDHTAAKATLRPWTKTANETRRGNERAGEKKPFEAILAWLA